MIAIGSCTVTIAAGLAACGGGSGSAGSSSAGSSSKAAAGGTHVSADAYVSALCTAMNPILKDARQGASVLSSATTASGIKSGLESYLGKLASDISAAATQAQAAGVPEIANGSTIASNVVKGLSTLASTLNALAGRAGSLLTGNVTALTAAASALASKASSAMASVNNITTGISASTALGQAAAKSSTCKALAASAGVSTSG